MMSRVEIRPLQIDKWHGKKGKESFARPKTYTALVDPVNMTYATGLTDKQEQEYSKKLGQDLSNHYTQGVAHPFWDSMMATVKLDNKTIFLKADVPIEFVKIQFLKVSKYVANSMKEWNEGRWPEATHVIYDESEEIEIKSTLASLKETAIIEKSKLSEERKRQIILIISGKDMKGQGPDYINVALSEEIDADPEKVLRYIKQDKATISSHAMVLEAIQKGVLRKVGHKITYNGTTLGGDVLDVADYFNNIENQDLKLRIMSAINS